MSSSSLLRLLVSESTPPASPGLSGAKVLRDKRLFTPSVSLFVCDSNSWVLFVAALENWERKLIEH